MKDYKTRVEESTRLACTVIVSSFCFFWEGKQVFRLRDARQNLMIVCILLFLSVGIGIYSFLLTSRDVQRSKHVWKILVVDNIHKARSECRPVTALLAAVWIYIECVCVFANCICVHTYSRIYTCFLVPYSCIDMESLDDRDLDDLLEDTLGEFSDEITSHPGMFTNRHSTITHIQGIHNPMDM